MTKYTITTGGDDGLTDEMVRGLISERRNASPRLARLLVQLERQLPRTLEVGDTCHLINGWTPATDNMKLIGLHEGKPWVLPTSGETCDDYDLPELAYGPRPS